MLTTEGVLRELAQHPSWDACTQLGQDLYAQGDQVDWSLADLCLYVCLESAHPYDGGRQGTMERFAAAIGPKYRADTLCKQARTAEVFPPEEGRPEAEGIYFRHFWTVANYEDRSGRTVRDLDGEHPLTPLEWIEEAAAHLWSSRQLVEALSGRDPDVAPEDDADEDAWRVEPIPVGQGALAQDDDGAFWLGGQRVENLLADLRRPEGEPGRLTWQPLPEALELPDAVLPEDAPVEAIAPPRRREEDA